jgi:hypothetical protein
MQCAMLYCRLGISSSGTVPLAAQQFDLGKPGNVDLNINMCVVVYCSLLCCFTWVTLWACSPLAHWQHCSDCMQSEPH